MSRTEVEECGWKMCRWWREVWIRESISDSEREGREEEEEGEGEGEEEEERVG